MELTVAGGYFLPGKTPQVINKVKDLITLGYVPYGTPTYNEASGWVSQLMVKGYGSATDYTLTTGYLDKTPYFPATPPVGGSWVLLGSLLARSNNFYVHAWLNGTAAGPLINISSGTTGTLPISRGGTGATTAANARNNLELGADDDVTFNSVTSRKRNTGTSAFIAQGVDGYTPASSFVTQMYAADTTTLLGQGEFRANNNGTLQIINRDPTSGTASYFWTFQRDGGTTFPGQVTANYNGEAFKMLISSATSAGTIACRRTDNTLQWSIGKEGTDNAMFFRNSPAGSYFALDNVGYAVLRTSNHSGYIYLDALNIYQRRASGRQMRSSNVDSALANGYFNFWGNTTGRPTVLEWGVDDGSGYLFYAQRNSDGTRVMSMNGSMSATAFNNSSDRELKDNILKIENACDNILKMHGYTYTLKESGLPYAGVIAQEVMEALPEAVGSFEKYEGGDSSGEVIGRFFNVDQGGVVGLLVQVCREQELRIRALEEKLK